MRVKVNQEACIGCGACQAIAPDVFEFNEEGYAETKEETNLMDTMNDELKEDVIDALEGCPTGAIVEVEEEDK